MDDAQKLGLYPESTINVALACICTPTGKTQQPHVDRPNICAFVVNEYLTWIVVDLRILGDQRRLAQLRVHSSPTDHQTFHNSSSIIGPSLSFLCDMYFLICSVGRKICDEKSWTN